MPTDQSNLQASSYGHHADPTIDLTMELMRRPSVTPKDEGCQQVMTERLKAIGFSCEQLDFEDVKNLWATRGKQEPSLIFAGHTDVVPTGPLTAWTSDPFTPSIRDDVLYGRGAADMKGSLAAMVIATERFIAKHPNHQGKIGFLITSDEEGPAKNGTVKVIEHLQAQQEHIDWCIVGEPSSTKKLGDIVKNGRRGSLGAELLIKGLQGHVAYPHLARNPIHQCAPALDELAKTVWDEGNEFFPPTSFQISNIHSGTGATNVVPGSVEVMFNLRFSTQLSPDNIKNKIIEILDKHSLEYEIQWNLSGQPFITETGQLVDATQQAIEEVCGYPTELSTAGGTSDGRFIAPTGAQVVELGPCNASIHQVDEHVRIAELIQLSLVYEKILERLLS